jgi:DnaK suppressor protein
MPDSTNPIDPGFIDAQRRRLAALRTQLLGSEAKESAEEAGLREERDREAQEPEEGAQDSAQSDVYRSLRSIDDRRLRRVERALHKIEEGSYGLSDASGQPIPKARLEAVPEAILTLEEEQAAEKT